MTDAPLAAVSRSSRLKGLAAFVAIVWMVAASFIAFEVVALLGVDVALSHPDALGDVMLSQATQASTACSVGPGERVEGTVPDISLNIARAAAWTLGLRVGEHAVVRQTPAAPDEMRKRSAQAVERLADSLGAPRPAPFTARQVAVANTEFVDYVEGDGAGTAHHLAVAYSVDACRLYKLGSFWGYSGSPDRRSLVNGRCTPSRSTTTPGSSACPTPCGDPWSTRARRMGPSTRSPTRPGS